MAEQVKVLESPEVEVLRTVRDKFSSGEWRWIKGMATDGEVGFCVSGAIRQATANLMLKDHVNDWGWRNVYICAQERVSNIIHEDIPSWNDRRNRKLPSVLEVLDKAIGQEVIT